MKTLVEWIEKTGLIAADLTMQITVTRVFTKTKRHAISDKLCDHYNRKILKLTVGDVVLTEAKQTAPFTADDFTDICSTVDLEYSLPMYEVLIDHETKDTTGLDLNAVDTVEINVGELLVRWETFDTILFAKTEDESNEALWKRFQTTDEFKKNPCTREQYLWLRQSHIDHMGGLDFSAYYGWYFRSVALLTPDGAIKPEILVEVMRLLAKCPDMTSEHQRHLLCHYFSVHPLHKPLFEALV
jgi:hypothetical protein